MINIGEETGIEKTLYVDGVKIEKEKGLARVYADHGVDVFIYDENLSETIVSINWEELKGINSITLSYSLDRFRGDWVNEIRIFFRDDDQVYIGFYYNSHLSKQYMHNFSQVVKQVVKEYQKESIICSWDDVYNWLSLSFNIPKKGTVFSGIQLCLVYVSQISKRALDMMEK